MSGRINEVEDIILSIRMLVFHAYGRRLDCNAALTLYVHAVKQLGFHVAFINRTRKLHQPVGQCRFTVVNMGDYAKIADMIAVIRHPLPPVILMQVFLSFL
ncbi:hypothetical protein SDC9_140770 [bioreactor metagenome]|uniref:Uncharacterized protein n=1 Tax=bioreactor metagenome TaxID=1076179 RepID=A0A645DVU4_9ZZZZ